MMMKMMKKICSLNGPIQIYVNKKCESFSRTVQTELTIFNLLWWNILNENKERWLFEKISRDAINKRWTTSIEQKE